jgi:4-hydroxy-2-oxoheptanedioate aldolase
MNKLEREMTALLNDLKANYHVTGIKAEFEAEGTRLEEAMRLKDVTATAGLGLNIKIGGCEAIKDMLDAVSLGAERIIAPMVETPYALKKFIKAAQLVYRDSIEHVDLLVNIETVTAYKNFAEMLKIPEIKYLNGIVIGRVDMVGSLDLSRDAINSKQVLDITAELAERAKEKDLSVVVGGGVSVDSLPFFQALPAGCLDRFETRKVIFNCPAAMNNPEEAFIKAVKFELMWLNNKRAYYSAIAREDEDRIVMMENRYKTSLDKIKSKDLAEA